MADDETIRVTVTIDKKAYDKIGELADRMNTSQARMASWLLEAGIEDNEWAIRMITSRVADGLREVLGMPRPSKRKTKPSA